MSKVVFRPFWSYDVLKTENWLSQMHLKGYALKKVNFKARLFYFVNVSPSVLYYRIVYEKYSAAYVPEAFIHSGFEKVCSSKNYYVIKTTLENPEKNPSYDSFLEKNTKLKKKLSISVISIFMDMYMLPLCICLTFKENKYLFWYIFILIILISILPFAWLFYSRYKLKKNIRQLNRVCTTGTRNTETESSNNTYFTPKSKLLSKIEEKKLKDFGKTIKASKLLWKYSPDKTEAWFEEMEKLGFNYCGIGSKIDEFVFMEGKPRNVKFFIDYQKNPSKEYYNINYNSGWNFIHSEGKLIIWAKEYDTVPPFFYSDSEFKLKNAKNIVFNFLFRVLPFYLLLFSFLSYITFKDAFFTFSPFFLLSLFPLLFFTFATLKMLFYYFRIKKAN